MLSEPKIISGNRFEDARGKISFVNDFIFDGIKRFYVVEHSGTETVRAWQGHQWEDKWFYVIEGSFLIAWVMIDNWQNPSPLLKADHQRMESTRSEILFVPHGYANGFKALLPGSKLIIFSSHTVDESNLDIRRYDKDLWFDWKNYL